MPRERAILVGFHWKGPRPFTVPEPAWATEESLEELAALASSAEAEVLERVVQTRERPQAATLLGLGKAREVAQLAEAAEADLVIFDHDLSPTQLRNLERLFQRKVVDRTQLILDIFARRARTREGQLQVELAQLNYLLPRLAGRGIEMSRLGGGIGTRGPGETQLETDRRRLYRRIRRLEKELASVRASRGVQRRKRQAIPLATAALVGYTNAGKSTLFNRLSGAEVLADDRLFATLDPTVRAVVLPSRRRVLLSDTVGFIRNLPVTLVEAFRATLEEVREAALLLHIVDLSSPQAARHIAHVEKVLAEIGAGEAPQILVLNKVDLLEAAGADAEAVRQRVLGGVALNARAVVLSARTGLGVDRLLEVVDEVVNLDPVVPATFYFPFRDGAEIHLLYERSVVTARRYVPDGCVIEAQVPESLLRRLAGYVAKDPPTGHKPQATGCELPPKTSSPR